MLTAYKSLVIKTHFCQMSLLWAHLRPIREKKNCLLPFSSIFGTLSLFSPRHLTEFSYVTEFFTGQSCCGSFAVGLQNRFERF